VNVKTGLERKRRDGRRIDIDQAHMRAPVHHVAAAELAPLPVAPLRLAELPDMLCPAGNLHGIWLPERSRIHRTGGPAAAGLTVAIGRELRISADYNLNSAAKAIALVDLLVLADWISPGEVANWMERELIESRRIGNLKPIYAARIHRDPSQVKSHLARTSNQPLTSGQRPHLFGVRRYLIRVTCGKRTVPTIRNWHTTPFIAPRRGGPPCCCSWQRQWDDPGRVGLIPRRDPDS